MLKSIFHEGMTTLQAKLLTDVGAVTLDGARANTQLIGDFFIRLVAGDEFEYPFLGRREFG